MQTPRSLRWIARFVLAWFVMFMGVAVASTWVHPQAMELICSGSGVIKLQITTDEGTQEVSASLPDCPACLPLGFLPVASRSEAGLVPALERLVPARDTVHRPWRSAAALPARGPPAVIELL